MVATVGGWAPTVGVCCGRKYRETGFEAIIPSARAGDFQVGMSLFTDTKEREAAADSVAYSRRGRCGRNGPGRSIPTTPAV